MSTDIHTHSGEFREQNSSPDITAISPNTLPDILHKGLDDFYARPTHGVFLTVIYILIALFTVFIGLGNDLLPLIFPLVSGFALIGPLAACGLYALSKRRESGQTVAWWHVFDVFTAPSRLAIAGMGLILASLFALWLLTAMTLYDTFLGSASPATLTELFSLAFGSAAGWQLIIIGCGVGFLFSILVFAITIVALPMLLDHKCSLGKAISTSLQAVRKNLPAMAAWYFLVAALFVLGALPLFIGWAVVVPVVGHATWHLYRAVTRQP